MRYAAALLLSALLAPATQAQSDPRAAKVSEGVALVLNKEPAAALAILDPVLASFDEEYPTRRAPIVYCAASGTTGGAGAPPKDAITLDDSWCRALWARGFALIDLGRVDEAVAPLERAVAMMPGKAQYQLELGYAHHTLKHWDWSIAVHAAALEAARANRDVAKRNEDMARAWFGMAYAEIELGQLDTAEQHLKLALEMAPGDEKLLGELEFLRQLRTQKAG